jgi:hypothetical protein
MHSKPRDVASIRLDNALALFDEFVRAAVKHPDAATLRGLERRFAERLQIQPSYWSQIKSRSRQIGERLARQFEQLSHKAHGWMDVPHDASGAPAPGYASGYAPAPVSHAPEPGAADSNAPRDDDERFIVGLVLTYYRRHPERARTRLLDLLGEVLVTSEASSPAAATAAKSKKPGGAEDDGKGLWQRSQQGVAPLKRKK